MTRSKPNGLHAAVCMLAVFVALTTCGTARAQKGGGGVQTGGSGQSGGNLPGVSYAKASWSKALTKAPEANTNSVILCYELVYTNSAAQPFVLEPRASIVMKSSNTSVACVDPSPNNPLEMDQQTVVAIDAQNVSISQLKILNINASDQQGQPINPTPLRPSFTTAATATTNLAGDKVYFLTWPNRLPGDALRTLSVNTLFTPAAIAAPWGANTFYPAGSVVTPRATPTGPYFLTLRGGISSDTEPAWGAATPLTATDGPAGTALTWQLLGSASPSGSTPKGWSPSTSYKLGDVIFVPTTMTYYELVAIGGGASSGKSGTRIPDFPVLGTSKISETQPSPTPAGYSQIDWIAIGPTLPSGTTPQQPPDQTVSLLTLQLPQSHSKSYFNLAAGMVVSTVRRPSFVVPAGLTGSNTSDAQRKTTDNPTLEPVLLLTFYPFPIDAEQPCTPVACLWHNAPGLNFGVSLTSPTSSFYFGLTLELVRNVEVVLGDNLQLVTALPSPAIPISNTASTPVTQQSFANGFFGGLTFNVSGFIQGLVSAGNSSGS